MLTLRADPHRLAGRHVGHLGGVLRPGLATPPQAGARARLPEPGTARGTVRQVTRDYLHYLAHHPQTAQHIAGQARRRLRLRLTPRGRWSRTSPALFYLRQRHPDQARAAGAGGTPRSSSRRSATRSGTPKNDLVATYRLMRVKVAESWTPSPRPPPPTSSCFLWQATRWGMMPMSGWPAPNGQPIVGAAWAPRPRRG